jgi:hypothetical protein
MCGKNQGRRTKWWEAAILLYSLLHYGENSKAFLVSDVVVVG